MDFLVGRLAVRRQSYRPYSRLNCNLFILKSYYHGCMLLNSSTWTVPARHVRLRLTRSFCINAQPFIDQPAYLWWPTVRLEGHVRHLQFWVTIFVRSLCDALILSYVFTIYYVFFLEAHLFFYPDSSLPKLEVFPNFPIFFSLQSLKTGCLPLPAIWQGVLSLVCCGFSLTFSFYVVRRKDVLHTICKLRLSSVRVIDCL